MSSCTNAQLSDQQNNPSLHSNEEEEDEEEDVDFNPFLKGTPSPDASSSLSSEIEDLDGNSSKPVVNDVQNYDVEHGEEVVTQNAQATCADSGNDVQVHLKCMKRKSNCDENAQENADNDETLDGEDEDAIWKRTRARYSLASFTLEELETFLQETDDEDDLQNVDDEEEYRKFLAAVLQGGDGHGQSAQDGENADDEDNDADFEIELEELLESDVDDSKRDTDQKLENERSARRPETRQNKRQRASSQYKKKLLEQTKRPLRPLLPIYPNGPVASLPSADGRVLTTEIGATYLSSTSGHGLINGFTPNQIGQLHCLLYEHVQLLIQVFSLCIHDPSRRQIASQVQELICEMLNKRNEIVACRSVSYPDICFHPSNMRPSVMDEIPNLRPPQCSESSSSSNMQAIVTQGIPTTMGKNAHAFNGQINASQTAGSFWVPFVNGPLESILDVAPLSLVGSYMDEVFTAIRKYRQRHLDSGCDTWNEREPLFQLPHFPSVAETNGEVLIGNMPPTVSSVPSAPGQRPPKKTLAASIVENVKRQSVALVPKDICKLAQRFFQLFNPSLFPHKPPPAAVANRVLFTDSEDELLALGMMEYNTDWKAIQQRFLPCKSKHQIFVRQKNRCSSKAPENPIKTVRRMKTSALTAEEIERIQEGLRVLKHDWMSVWRFIVPHRDPSLLPRQWRIALGTQKSYKLDAVKKEKRRVYESNRRRCKTADLANWQQDNQVDSIGGEDNSRDDYVDNPNDAYVHQAFLADWRPDASNLISSQYPSLNIGDGSLPFGSLPREDIQIMNQSHMTHIHGFPYAHYYQYSHNIRHFPSNSVKMNNQVTGTTQDAGKSSSHLWPYRTRRTDGAHLVKLAPDLPPVNLPPTVRVISQAAFRSNQNGVSKKAPSPGDSTGDGRKENLVPQLPLVANSTSMCLTTSKGDGSNQVRENIANSCPEDRTSSHPEESATLHDANGAEERGTESDLHMHPLLFQSSEDGRLSYYPLSCTTAASSSFTFFSANQPQLNLSLFHSPNPGRNFAGSLNKSSKTMKSSSVSCGIDFHPLLQRTEEENNDSAAACSNTHKCEGLGSKSAHFQNSSPPVNSGSSATVTKSSCPIEKANELDLEIHLSSTSIVDQTRGTSLVGTSNDAKSLASMSSGNKIIKHKSKSPFHQHCESCPMDEGNLVSAADASAVPNNNDDKCDMDDRGDQSPPEIVMEQEELSDSDEETEEDVQFECEEMADSDGDEDFDCDSIAEVQNKECLNHATEVTTDAVYGDKQCEWRNPVHPSGSTSVETECSPILKMNLTSFGKDSTNSSWLTLDFSTSIDPPSMKAKQAECLIGSSPDAKNLASRRPNRSYKKKTPSYRSGASFKDVDRAQKLGLDLLAVSTLKKPRKRPSRSNTGRASEKPSYDQDKGS